MFQVPVTVLNDGDAARSLAEAPNWKPPRLCCGATFVLGTGVGLALTNGSLISTLHLKDYLHWPNPEEPPTTPEQKQFQRDFEAWISVWFQNLGSTGQLCSPSQPALATAGRGWHQFRPFTLVIMGGTRLIYFLLSEIAILIYNLQSLVGLKSDDWWKVVVNPLL